MTRQLLVCVLFMTGCSAAAWNSDRPSGTPGVWRPGDKARRDHVPKSLSFIDVVKLARVSAPAVRLAAADVDIARGRRVGARVLARDNPVLAAGVGNRWGDTRTTDREVSLSIPIELGGKRGKRIAVADADVDWARHRVSEVRRKVVGAAAAAYFRVLRAQQLVALARERRDLAKRLVATAQERKAAGAATKFDVNLANGELSRANSAIDSERRGLAAARTRLGKLLGLNLATGLDVNGSLDERSFLGDPAGAANPMRPDVRVARANLKVADARVVLADTARWPKLSFRVTYGREESADIVFGSMVITLPLFERGQGRRASRRARQRRALIVLEQTKNVARAEVDGARVAYLAAVKALGEMKKRALPLAIENERMARESYTAGKLNLTGLLVVRRGALQTRREYLDRSLEAALAAVDLWVAQGATWKTRR